MRHGNNISVTICLFVVICFGSRLYAVTEPNEQDIQLAKERMQQLREVYKEVQQAETELYRLIQETESNEPLLWPTKNALKKMKDFYAYDLAKDHQRFQKYLNNSKDRKAAYRLYSSCKATFSHSKIVELLNDPNHAKLLKKPYVIYFRHISINSNFSFQEIGFDANDPNDERLWKNIKEIYFKKLPDEYLQRMRQYYIEGKGVPDWLPDYAGNMGFADAMINMYEGGLFILTPQDVRDAEKQVKEVYRKMGTLYPSWRQMRHLLVGENNPDNELIIRAVQEHMRLFPTAR